MSASSMIRKYLGPVKTQLQTQMATTKAFFAQKQDSWAYLTELQTSVNKIITTHDQIQQKDDQWNALIVRIKDAQALQDEETLYDQTANHAQTGHLPLIQIANDVVSDYQAQLSTMTTKLTTIEAATIQASAQTVAGQAATAQAMVLPPATLPTIKAPNMPFLSFRVIHWTISNGESFGMPSSR